MSHVSCFMLHVSCFMFLSGCASFHVQQTNLFTDEDGNVISVEYGTRSEDHSFMMTVPQTGKRVEFKSNLMVRVTLPDGRSFKGYRCYNPVPQGTMYMSDNERWKYLASGFSAFIYERLPNGEDYVRRFEGTLAKGSD